jgi:hypothetical protein
MSPYYAYAQLRIATHIPGSGIQADRGSRENLAPHQRPGTDQAVVGGHCLKDSVPVQDDRLDQQTRRLKSPPERPYTPLDHISVVCAIALNYVPVEWAVFVYRLFSP